MNKLIGGLLVLSLLGRPAVLKIDFVAYEVYKSNQILIDYLRKYDEITQAEDFGELDRILGGISSKKRYIDKLSKEKDSVVKDMENLMRKKAAKKETLSNEFIYELKDFNDTYNEERGEVEQYIEKIENLDINNIQKEILHKDTDYEYILYEFDNVIKSQNKIIAFLEKVIYLGRRTLATA